ncbi:hypothetical protein FACS1894139_19030 [Planctomycetales bacterium]|nr:hypothetical protein FACS1894139_19030 [Planctomycetales bacterium]
MNLTNRETVPPFTTKDSSEIRELFNPRLTADCKNLSVAEATLAAGQATLPHRHPHSEEVYYFLRGEGELTVNGETRRVAANDTAHIPAGATHQCRNAGATPLAFLCFCAPPYAHADTVLAE